MNDPALRRTALLMLLLANLSWGLSFPLIKAIAHEHARLLPGSGTWFITAMCIAPRFLLAAAFLWAVAGRTVLNATRSEVRQGVLLGVSASLGMLFQTDGLQFTAASTSAFLTQFYALLIPLYLAVRNRRWPRPTVLGAAALVLAGVAVLARLDPRTFHLGRGELETLVSSGFFMWQILLLEHRGFAGNRVRPVTAIMFTTQAAAFVAMALATAPSPGAVLVPWTSGPWLAFTFALTAFCTLGSFLLMNRWQPAITATEAGLIYCTEPIFTSVLALFLPALLSAWAGFSYPNETVTWHLLVGGSLITAANLLVQLRPDPPAGPAAQRDSRARSSTA
jgi:drug/metabolite transporter (DMT)-like permease